MPGELRRRRRSGNSSSRESPSTSVLPLLEAAGLEVGLPGALGLQRGLIAAGYLERSLSEQRGLAGHPAARVRFHVPAVLARLLSKRPGEVVPLLRPWVEDPSPFVRRAAIEAMRPRGVWVRNLRWAIETPALLLPLLPLLQPLRRETLLYPASATANFWNDISRTPPQLAREVLRDWRHAPHPGPLAPHVAAKGLRTLVKQGDPPALRLLGFAGLPLAAEARQVGAPARPNRTLEFQLLVANHGPAAAARLVYEIETPGKLAGRPRRKRYHGRGLRLPEQDRLRVRCRERIFDPRAAQLLDGACVARFFLNGDQVAEAAFELRRDGAAAPAGAQRKAASAARRRGKA